MIRSMTGYGRSEMPILNKIFTVEIKGVNHRYLDIRLHAPREYYYLEEKFKKQITKYISRGRIEIYLRYDIVGEENKEIVCNYDLARSYFDTLQSLRDRLDLQDEISLEFIAEQPDVLLIQNKEVDLEVVETGLFKGIEKALLAFQEMKSTEGRELGNDLKEKLINIEEALTIIERRSPLVVTEHHEKMSNRVAELLQGVEIDVERIALETSIFADKSSIDEELVRLGSHISQFRDILDTGGVVGRKLDFMAQELNREVNTIGSKANDYLISKHVVECKAALEKIREQVQNIE